MKSTHASPHAVKPALQPVGSGAADDVDDDEVVDELGSALEAGVTMVVVVCGDPHFARTGLAVKKARERTNAAVDLIVTTPS